MPGDTLTYTLFYQNTGLPTANQVAILDQLPLGVSFGSFANRNAGAARGQPLTSGQPNAGPSVRFDLGSLAGGASVSVQVTVQVNSNTPAGSCATNNGTISAAGLAQSQPSNPVTTLVTVPQPP